MSNITEERVQQATDAYKQFVHQMGPRYVHSPANILALGTVVEPILESGAMVTVEHFVSAWLLASNEGRLEEPLTEAQLKAAEEAKIRERNLRLEQKDRQAGATFVNSKGEVQKSHMSDTEKEDLLEQSKKESAEEYKKAIAWIRGEADRRNQPQELAPSAIDAANQLSNILSPVTVSSATRETKQAITKWMRSTDSKLLLAARRNNPELAAKADKILLKTFEADI
jgi:hypothetical protein